MEIDTGRTVVAKRCKLTASHVEHHWYDAPNDKWSKCDGGLPWPRATDTQKIERRY